MATLVQELTEEGAYDLDADPAVEGANEATWLDADSVSPALARDKKLASRVQALERAIASLGDELALHGGKLRIWCGAALHNDHAAAMLEAQARARQKGNVIGAVEDRADRAALGASHTAPIGATRTAAAASQAACTAPFAECICFCGLRL